ncbi:MAG: DNA polymerase III subunit alpha, partial [Chloroflexi bacterium]|nr:DNA polymerase III subunit alpha [Chloroflexota bacterium]
MFTHLHVHTEFSMLDGLSRLAPLVNRAKELGMDSLAITDHGGMYGVIDFYRLAKDAGVKPIIGCEMYVASGSRFAKNPNDKSPYHMTVLAQDARGYQNLLKLVTRSNIEGFYYKPRIDRELLEKHHEGLIILSGCPSGEVPKLIAQGRMDDAAASASWYRELFGDRYFLELMEHGGVPDLPAINKGLVELQRQLDIPVVATNDSHYIYEEDAPLQDILICIHTNTNIQDESRLKMEESSYYLKSHEEMVALYPEMPEAISNTERVAEMCNLELDFSQLRLPEYKVPDGMTAGEYLYQLCWDGLRRRIERVSPQDEERLTYELEVIKQTQFDNYFLVVWDIAKFVRERDIFFAVRGSAAASLVLFCLGVTNINPLPYRLVFERFLNVERKEMPDIDMDFQDDRREEVINYVVSKYGREHVAQIITFGTLGARASIGDVGRALVMPYADVDRVAKLVPFKLH